MNEAAFGTLLGGLLSPDNTVRSQAEVVMRQLRDSDPNTFVRMCLGALAASDQFTESLQQMACSILRTALVKASDTIWFKLAPETQALAKSQLLALVQAPHPAPVRRAMTNTISDLGAFLCAPLARDEDDADSEQQQQQQQKQPKTRGGWPELFPFLLKCTSSTDAAQRETGFSVFALLSILVGPETFRPHLGLICNVLAGGLADQAAPDVRYAAMAATASFLRIMQPKRDAAHISQFRALLPGMMEALQYALAHDASDAAAILDIFVQIAEARPMFFRPAIAEFTSALFNIAKEPSCDTNVRKFAMEVIVTLIEQRPTMMRKIPGFVQPFIELVLAWMVAVDDSLLEPWLDFEEPDDVSVSELGDEYLERLSIALHGRTVVPVLLPHLSTLMASPDWKQRQAGLSAVSMCSTGCRAFLKPHLAEMFRLASSAAHDAHPYVRWAALDLLVQMLREFQPFLQKHCGADVVQMLVLGCKDAVPRVQVCAVNAIEDFVASATTEAVHQHAPAFLTCLQHTLAGPRIELLESSVSILTLLADYLKERFQPYYATFVPVLKNIIAGAKDKSVRLLRGKAVDCVCTIGAAVGRETFARDALEVMQEMMGTQICEADDPQIVFLETGFVKIAECLGADFAQFLPTVIQPTLQRAATKPEVQDIDISDGTELPEGWQMMTIGDLFVGVNTEQIVDKTTAITVLSSYAASLEGAFYPYIESVLKVVIPELKCVFHESVRKAAYDILPQLMISAKASPAATPADLQRLWLLIYNAIMDALPGETDNETIAAGIESLYTCISVIKQPCLTEAQLNDVAKLLATMLVGWQQDMAGHFGDDDDSDDDECGNDSDADDDSAFFAKQKGGAGAPLCDELGDEFDEDMIEDVAVDMLSLVIDNICDGIEKIVEYHKDAFMAPFQRFLSAPVAKLVQPDAEVAEKQYGLCIYGILAQYCTAASVGALAGLVPVMLGYCMDKDRQVSQMACFGVGACAKSFGDAFVPFVTDSLRQLAAVVSRGKDCDNAICAVGKILRYHAAHVPAFQDVLVRWISALPLDSNASEARTCHTLLLDFCELYPDLLTSAQSTKILAILGAIVGTSLLEKRAAPRAQAVLRRLAQLVPPNVFSSLPPKHQAAIQAFMNQSFDHPSSSSSSGVVSPTSPVSPPRPQ